VAAVLETVLGAIAAALISTGTSAALSAAKRSGETRDAVKDLTLAVAALNKRVSDQFADDRAAREAMVRRIDHLDLRVSTLEAGFVDWSRRGRG